MERESGCYRDPPHHIGSESFEVRVHSFHKPAIHATASREIHLLVDSFCVAVFLFPEGTHRPIGLARGFIGGLLSLSGILLRAYLGGGGVLSASGDTYRSKSCTT